MKKLSLIIFALIFSQYAICQQNPWSFTLKRGVSIDRPKGSKKLLKNEILTLKKNYKKSLIDTSQDIIYQHNHLLISYWDLGIDTSLRHTIESTQRTLTLLLKNSKQYLVTGSKIVTVNHTKYFILEFEKEDEVYLRFMSEVKDNGVSANGMIQFKKPYEEEAQKALQEILPTVKFNMNERGY